MGLVNDARVEALLDRLHAQSSAQDETLGQYSRRGGARQRTRERSHGRGFVNDPNNGFRTLTLPYPGGLELTVRT